MNEEINLLINYVYNFLRTYYVLDTIVTGVDLTTNKAYKIYKIPAPLYLIF